MPAVAQLFDHVDLAFGQNVGDHLVDADAGGHRRRSCRVIPGQQHGPKAVAA